jgi:hypothetical protein
VIAALRRRFGPIREAERGDWHLATGLAVIAARLPADLADEAAAAIPREARELPYWATPVAQFDELLRFRYEMLRALREA